MKVTAIPFIKILILGIVASTLSSCISRLSRPQISGVVVDYDKKPVADCKVGETVTGKDGKFILPEKRYNTFILTEMMVMEAPPLMVFEQIEKKGFEKDVISRFEARGGSKSKGAKFDVDTIFLKKNDQQFDVSTLLNDSRWKLSFTKNADTIYLIKDGFKEWCKTERCSQFSQQYEMLTESYYNNQSKNLPDGMIRRQIDVQFKAAKSVVQLQQIREYSSTFNGPNKKPDTLYATGSWKLIDNKTVSMSVNTMKMISGTFKLSEIDLYQLKLTK